MAYKETEGFELVKTPFDEMKSVYKARVPDKELQCFRVQFLFYRRK